MEKPKKSSLTRAFSTKKKTNIRVVIRDNLSGHMSGDGKKLIRILMKTSRSPKVSRKEMRNDTSSQDKCEATNMRGKAGLSATLFFKPDIWNSILGPKSKYSWMHVSEGGGRDDMEHEYKRDRSWP